MSSMIDQNNSGVSIILYTRKLEQYKIRIEGMCLQWEELKNNIQMNLKIL